MCTNDRSNIPADPLYRICWVTNKGVKENGQYLHSENTAKDICSKLNIKHPDINHWFEKNVYSKRYQKEHLNFWKQMMCQRCTEGPEDINQNITCTLDTGIKIHTAPHCIGCRYDNPKNPY